MIKYHHNVKFNLKVVNSQELSSRIIINVPTQAISKYKAFKYKKSNYQIFFL